MTNHLTLPEHDGPVTIRDIAAAAKVSQSTVSRVLNGSPTPVTISEKTRRRVQRIADELGYRPNPFARGLTGRSVRMIGVIARDVGDPFMSSIVSHLSAAAHGRGYGVLLGHARSSSEEALQLRDVLDPRHCDGVVLVGDLQDDEERFLAAIATVNRSVVGLCLGQTKREITTVNIDNERGTLLVLEHLSQLGHARIGFIDGGWIRGYQERRQVYRTFMTRQGGEPDRFSVTAKSIDFRGGYEAARQLLTIPVRPTAIFVSGDSLAVGALKAAAELGLRVPDDVSVVGFDDIELASYTVPGLTTVHQPVAEMAHVALERLLEMIEQPEAAHDPEVILVEPRLVVRESTTRHEAG